MLNQANKSKVSKLRERFNKSPPEGPGFCRPLSNEASSVASSSPRSTGDKVTHETAQTTVTPPEHVSDANGAPSASSGPNISIFLTPNAKAQAIADDNGEAGQSEEVSSKSAKKAASSSTPEQKSQDGTPEMSVNERQQAWDFFRSTEEKSRGERPFGYGSKGFKAHEEKEKREAENARDPTTAASNGQGNRSDGNDTGKYNNNNNSNNSENENRSNKDNKETTINNENISKNVTSTNTTMIKVFSPSEVNNRTPQEAANEDQARFGRALGVRHFAQNTGSTVDTMKNSGAVDDKTPETSGVYLSSGSSPGAATPRPDNTENNNTINHSSATIWGLQQQDDDKVSIALAAAPASPAPASPAVAVAVTTARDSSPPTTQMQTERDALMQVEETKSYRGEMPLDSTLGTQVDVHSVADTNGNTTNNTFNNDNNKDTTPTAISSMDSNISSGGALVDGGTESPAVDRPGVFHSLYSIGAKMWTKTPAPRERAANGNAAGATNQYAPSAGEVDANPPGSVLGYLTGGKLAHNFVHGKTPRGFAILVAKDLKRFAQSKATCEGGGVSEKMGEEQQQVQQQVVLPPRNMNDEFNSPTSERTLGATTTTAKPPSASPPPSSAPKATTATGAVMHTTTPNVQQGDMFGTTKTGVKSPVASLARSSDPEETTRAKIGKPKLQAEFRELQNLVMSNGAKLDQLWPRINELAREQTKVGATMDSLVLLVEEALSRGEQRAREDVGVNQGTGVVDEETAAGDDELSALALATGCLGLGGVDMGGAGAYADGYVERPRRQQGENMENRAAGARATDGPLANATVAAVGGIGAAGSVAALGDDREMGNDHGASLMGMNLEFDEPSQVRNEDENAEELENEVYRVIADGLKSNANLQEMIAAVQTAGGTGVSKEGARSIIAERKQHYVDQNTSRVEAAIIALLQGDGVSISLADLTGSVLEMVASTPSTIVITEYLVRGIIKNVAKKQKNKNRTYTWMLKAEV